MEARALSRLKFRDTWRFLDSCPGQHLWSCMLSGSRVGEGKRQVTLPGCYLVCTCPVSCRSDGWKQGPHGRRVDFMEDFLHPLWYRLRPWQFKGRNSETLRVSRVLWRGGNGIREPLRGNAVVRPASSQRE